MSKMPDYKGYNINVESNGVFYALKDGEVVASAKTLDELKKQVDLVSRFKGNIPVFVQRDYWTFKEELPQYTEGKLTSIKQERSGYGSTFHYRVTYKERGSTSWHDYPASQIFKKTPENESKVNELLTLQNDIRDLDQKREKIARSLVAYTDKELGV